MDDDTPWPDEPEVPRHIIESIAKYAEDCVEYLEWEHKRAREHGHTIQDHALRVLEGWRFVSVALPEAWGLVEVE